MNLYTDMDAYCCEWLRRLVDTGELPAGDVLQVDLREVEPEQVRHYTQRHWCCGIGGWPLALVLAGWPVDRQADTCSLPCQPFSSAGKRKGTEDERHLWPAYFRLVQALRPPVIFGEQVSSSDVIGKVGGKVDGTDQLVWLDGIQTDLEKASYTVGAVDLPAAGVGAPHKRQRLYWVADAEHSESRLRNEQERATSERRDRPAIDSDVNGMADAERDGGRIDEQERGPEGRASNRPAGSGDASDPGSGDTRSHPSNGGCNGQATHPGSLMSLDRLGHSASNNQQRVSVATMHGQWESIGGSSWDHYRIVHCRDGKARRVSSQSGDEPLASGIPRKLGPELAGLRGMAKDARRNRVGRLRGYGNALCVPVAVEFVRAFLECEQSEE